MPLESLRKMRGWDGDQKKGVPKKSDRLNPRGWRCAVIHRDLLFAPPRFLKHGLASENKHLLVFSKTKATDMKITAATGTTKRSACLNA